MNVTKSFRSAMRKSLLLIRNQLLRPLTHLVGKGPFSSVALDYLDLQLVTLMGRRRGGVFVEAGANDGISQSNTYYLEKVLGWSGVLVEPMPELASLCRKRRRGARVVNAALVRENYPNPTVKLERAGLMSVINDGVLQASAVEDHVRQGRDVQRLDEQAAVEVPARTLQQILTDANISHVDFLSLDVEGYELEVLKGIAFDQTTFDWILVEVRPSNEQQIDALLGNHGYVWERIWRTPSYANKIYRRANQSN
ncbi:FkbM family methyltransferase [Stieleria sedimenti]|uniref:FkbM family methyltransferase n=1 Tax=Stieleria sedimenti TaxID=2976331 RepID=UPI00217FBE21|nr:FkbM family methyltransferase [Stieleria sedimenti]